MFNQSTYNLDCAIPRTGYKVVFGDGIPGGSKGLALVLMEDHDWELPHANVEELERSIAAGNHELVLVDLRPGQVVYRVVCIEPINITHRRVSLVGFVMASSYIYLYIYARLLNLDTLRRQRKSEEPAVSNDAEVGGCADGDARVVVWRVFDRVGIVPLGAELEHRGHCLCCERSWSAGGRR